MKVQSQNFRKSEMPGRPDAQRSHARSISAVTLLSIALLFRLSDEKLAQQEPSTQEGFWPELDVFIRLNQTTRIYLLTALTQAREFPYTEGMFGAHPDFGLQPKIRMAMKDLDVSKMQYLSFRAGYRYNRTIHDNGDPFREHRSIMELPPFSVACQIAVEQSESS
jgi:hypothetical protein